MSYKIEITINTDNAAFDVQEFGALEINKGKEVRRIMDKASQYIGRTAAMDNESFNIHFPQQRSFNDHNGNAVCTVTINRRK